MRPRQVFCRECGKIVEAKCPVNEQHVLTIIGVTVDLIVEYDDRLVLVQRADDKWALPGGFVDYTETLEQAVEREAREELGATKVVLLRQFHTYGDHTRDDGRRNVSVVYILQVDRVQPSEEELKKDGLKKVEPCEISDLPDLAFDHNEIVADYLADKRRLLPLEVRRSNPGQPCNPADCVQPPTSRSSVHNG